MDNFNIPERVYWKGMPIELIKSERGSLHCFQACISMVLKSLKGIDITLKEAENLTGFVADKDTWPNQGFLSLANFGINVTSIEALNPFNFVDSPENEIKRLYTDPEVADYIVKITNIEKERNLVKQCLEHPKINFVVRPPVLEDVYNGINQGGLVIALLDYGQLHGIDKYEGHFVLITELNNSQACIYDPGPPGEGPWYIEIDILLKALSSDDNSGQLIILEAL